MPKTTKPNCKLTDKQRLRREIVEMAESQHRLGLITDDEVEQVTERMLGRDGLTDDPQLPSPDERVNHGGP